MEDDRKFVQLVVAENNEGKRSKRGLFHLDTKIWIKKGDILWSLGKFWEVLDTVKTFDNDEDYHFIITCCDLYDVTGAEVEAYYRKHDIEE